MRKLTDLERLARKFGGRIAQVARDDPLFVFPTPELRKQFEQALTEWRQDDDRASTLQAD